MGDSMAKKKKPFKALTGAAVGLGGLGVGLGVSAAVAGRAAAGTPAASISSAFPTIASGAGIATTVSVGGGLLKQVKGLSNVTGKKYKKRIRRR